MGLQGWCAAHGSKLSGLETHEGLRAHLTDFRKTVRTAAHDLADQLGLPRPVKVTAVAPVRLARIVRQVKSPLRDASAVNTTRFALVRALEGSFAVRTGTGTQTKWNRRINNVPKSHTIDAICAGASDVAVASIPDTVMVASSTGRGSYARTRRDAFGFARLRPTRTKRHFGLATGDLVRATVAKGKNACAHVGRVAVRARGSLDINVGDQTIHCVNHKYCRLVQRADGWSYRQQREMSHVA